MLLLHSSVDGFRDCLHLLVITDDAIVNICTQVLGWTYVFSFLEYIFKLGTAGSGFNSRFKF